MGRKNILRPFAGRASLIFILIMLLLAYFLRLHRLDAFSFWTDESLTSLRAGYTLSKILRNDIIIQGFASKDTHPPFYYLIIHFTRLLFGETDFAYRFPSVLWGVLLVPLMVQFGRRLGSRLLGMMAGMLTAVNPFQVWYGQEARMYSLLVLLGTITSYMLWRALKTGIIRRYLPPYLLLAGLAIYTHYSAVFLLAAQGGFWALLLWRRGKMRLLLGTAVFLTLIGIPLIPNTIPRLFTGVEALYIYVSPLVILQDIFRAFSLGITMDFSQLSSQMLSYGALSLLLIGLTTCSAWLDRLFLSVYLLAVPVGLMAGSLIKPMYMTARHIIIGSPAFILLIASGMTWLLSQSKQPRVKAAKFGWAAAVIAGGTLLVSGPQISINNLYNNSQYAKDDFRSLIRYIEEQAGENDVVVYNDAVLLPTHAHYNERVDMPATALPVYPRIAPDSLSKLQVLTDQYDRIWFLPDPPDDGRDKQHLVAKWLDENLIVVDRHNTYGRGANLQVIAYATAPPNVDTLPADASPLNLVWSDIPALRGIQLQFKQPAALPVLWFDLYWQAGVPFDPDINLLFSLRDGENKTWVSQNTPLAVPATTYPDAGIVRQNYRLSLPFGIPPGSYTLFIDPQPSVSETALGNAQPLTEITLALPEEWPILQARPSTTPPLYFQNGLTLLGAAIPDAEVRPGHNLPLTLYWQAEKPLAPGRLIYSIELVGPKGIVLRSQEGIPGGAELVRVPAGTPILENTGLYFRPETKPGVYQVRWRVWQDDTLQKGRPSWRPWFSKTNVMGSVEVKSWPLNTQLPELGDNHLVQAHFGSTVDLYGFDLERQEGGIKIALYWQALATPEEDYFSFIHLIDGEGNISLQAAFIPVTGLRPTKGWRAGEVLTDSYVLNVPPDLSPGLYTLTAGLFNPETEARPSVTIGNQAQPDNQISLGQITLP